MLNVQSSIIFLCFLGVIQCVISYHTLDFSYNTTTAPPPTSTFNPISPTPKIHSIDKWGVTKINVKKISYAWTILNYSLNGKFQGEYIESPTFSIDDYNFRLALYPKGYSYDTYKGNDYMDLYLSLLPDSKIVSTFPIMYKFGLKNNMENDYYFPMEEEVGDFSSNSKSGYNNFILTRLLSDYLHDDKLTILAEVAVNVGYTNSSGSCGSPGLDDTSNTELVNTYENLLNSETFSDIKLNAGWHEFKAHKAILASASPVFMGEILKMQEAGKSVLEIDGVESSVVFNDFLRFVYTGRFDKFYAKDLLSLAKRFQIKRLESLCEKALCQSLNSDNAMDLLNLATNNNATNLKAQALKYITSHNDSTDNRPTFTSLISQLQNSVNDIRSLIHNSTN